jgi:Holliday junction DNA helicase RuvA
MYEFIRGKMVEKNPASVVVDCNGMAYLLNISLQTYTRLGDSEQCRLYTHLVVKEDALILYGFYDKQERELFRQLISVTGIGAGTARMILSSLPPDEVIEAIVRGNAELLKSIKGIGLKTAQRIIIDLKDKLSKDLLPSEKLGFAHNTTRDEALSGLVILGFQKLAAEKALNKVIEKEGMALTVEQMIRQALKFL